MRFKIDENLPLEVKVFLEENGHDALTVHDQGMRGCSDDILHRICMKEDRILLTLDLDFADIRTYLPGTAPGIIVIRTMRQDKPYVLQLVSSIMELMKTEQVHGKLWIVEQDKLRIRE
jgi:predicted nuclease of predicted toxin-antitoxin system